MKVINSKGGVKARSVNDRAIEHSISQKTELSKKNGKLFTHHTVMLAITLVKNTSKMVSNFMDLKVKSLHSELIQRLI